eukprot:CAMPEP_0182489784 /NCGR_PEP_ID=MMETSP1319-20130603/49081_1 /TAXON_ID=172717 /ORGANISM="Bolidomonas pacifica, Strain RCC208" /LENGTH=137 /DNA_ID=CAMNT_0024691909 /DNA_START=436 /DNA_END=845 /DNA_ORIENTATION=-
MQWVGNDCASIKALTRAIFFRDLSQATTTEPGDREAREERCEVFPPGAAHMSRTVELGGMPARREAGGDERRKVLAEPLRVVEAVEGKGPAAAREHGHRNADAFRPGVELGLRVHRAHTHAEVEHVPLEMFHLHPPV